MKTTQIAVIVILILAVGGAAFFAGMRYQEGQRGTTTFSQLQNFNGQRGNAALRNGFRPVAGDITSVDSSSITVKMADGSSRIVIFSDKTAINKEASASAADLKIGERVTIVGTANSDGSVTAQDIQLNPVSRGQFNRN